MDATSQGLNRYQCRRADRSPRPLNGRKTTCRLAQIQLCSTGVLRSGENQTLDSRENSWSMKCYAINAESPNRCVCARSPMVVVSLCIDGSVDIGKTITREHPTMKATENYPNIPKANT